MSTPKKNLKALVLAGDGINCELESAEAFEHAGFVSKIRHINDIVGEGLTLDKLSLEYAALCLPGGFSFGDDLTSGKVLSLKIKHALKWDLAEYARRGGLAIGICNGFQALIKLGVFGEMVSITANRSGKFLNHWVKLEPNATTCVWLKGIGSLDLPIRHGEGRVMIPENSKKEILSKMTQKNTLCLKYSFNPNGSVEDIAGLCDVTGRIFGLMPHPEAFLRWTAYPGWTEDPDRAGAPGEGGRLFENAFTVAKENSNA